MRAICHVLLEICAQRAFQYLSHHILPRLITGALVSVTGYIPRLQISHSLIAEV